MIDEIIITFHPFYMVGKVIRDLIPGHISIRIRRDLKQAWCLSTEKLGTQSGDAVGLTAAKKGVMGYRPFIV